jgi:hypothetical protein
MANQFRQIGAGVNALSPTDFFVQINNTIQYGDIIDIYLPNTSLILDGNTNVYPYTGIRLSSIANVVAPPPPTEPMLLSAVENLYSVNLIAQDGDLINSSTMVTINVPNTNPSISSEVGMSTFSIASSSTDLKGTGLLIMLTGQGIWMTIPFISNNIS